MTIKTLTTLTFLMLALDVQSQRGYHNLGITAFNKGKTEEALDFFNAANLVAPTAESFHAIGIVHTRQKAFEKARQAFENALSIEPMDPTYLYSLAVIEKKLGFKRLAMRYFQLVNDITPDSMLGNAASKQITALQTAESQAASTNLAGSLTVNLANDWQGQQHVFSSSFSGDIAWYKGHDLNTPWHIGSWFYHNPRGDQTDWSYSSLAFNTGKTLEIADFWFLLEAETLISQLSSTLYLLHTGTHFNVSKDFAQNLNVFFNYRYNWLTPLDKDYELEAGQVQLVSTGLSLDLWTDWSVDLNANLEINKARETQASDYSSSRQWTALSLTHNTRTTKTALDLSYALDKYKALDLDALSLATYNDYSFMSGLSTLWLIDETWQLLLSYQYTHPLKVEAVFESTEAHQFSSSLSITF